MQFKKGEIVRVKHQRTGTWIGRVVNAFDTETTVWYMIKLWQPDHVEDRGHTYTNGNIMSAKASMCEIEKIKGEDG